MNEEVIIIRDHNIKPHLDIERDIQNKKNGLFTFNLRINQGNIEDYAQYETINASDYTNSITYFKQERVIARYSRTTVTEDRVRTDER